MGLIKILGQRKYAFGPGVMESSPAKGPRRFVFLLRTYFGRLIGINLLFVLCCVPVFTIPASICALNRYTIKMVRDGYGFSVDDYWQEWKEQIFRSMPAILIPGLPMAFAYYLLSMYAGGQAGFGVLVVAIFWIFLALLMGAYVFVLLAMLDLPLLQIIKNSAILILLEWKHSLCVLGLTLLTLVASLSLFPASLIVLCIGWFSWCSLALCCIINEPVQKRILTPYAALQRTSADDAEGTA